MINPEELAICKRRGHEIRILDTSWHGLQRLGARSPHDRRTGRRTT